MKTIPDPKGFITSVAILLAQIGINCQNPFYNPIIDIMKGMKDIVDQQKIMGFLQKLSERVQALEQQQIPIEYFSSPRFAKELKMLLYSQQISELNEKKDKWANYFVSCCFCVSIDNLNLQKYCSLLKNIDIVEYYILTLLPHYSIASCNASSIFHQTKKIFKNITKDDIIFRLDTLLGYNLTKGKSYQEIKAVSNRFGNIKALGEDEYYIRTTLGTKFIEFIQDNEIIRGIPE